MIFLATRNVPKIESKLESVRQCLSENVYQQMKLCYFKNGELVFTEGEKTEYLYIILDGNCKVFKTLKNGKTILLCCYEDIQILGEFEFFGDSLAKTNIQALKDTYCLAISVNLYRDLIMSDNKFLQFICRQTCAKIDRNNINTAINLSYPLEQRLAGYIFIMQNDGVFSGNYTMLAEYLGCSHRHLLRTLHLLCNDNLIEKKEATYLIKDISALEHLADGIYQQ